MFKAAASDLASIEAVLTQPAFIFYLKGRLMAAEGKLGPCESSFKVTEAHAPSPGYEFVYDWYVERVATGDIFRANGRSEASIRRTFPGTFDVTLQRIESSKRQVLIKGPGRYIDTQA
jgi:hypothetical protein